MPRWPRILWIVLVLLLPAAIIHNHFSNVFKCPSCYLFENTGDGLKNYYTLAYYVQHDSGWHFSGMNYPYGEHIIYTDNQPVLAMALGWIDRHITDLDRHVVGILNVLLLLSLYVAVLVSYFLLRRWDVGRLWGLASSMCIIFLSPQLWRFHGHFALGYVCFLPMLFLFLDYVIRSSHKRWLWSILTGVLIVIMSLTHMYFLLISLVVVFGLMAFWWWYHRTNKAYVRSVIPWLSGVLILPAAFLLLVKSSTDKVTDRPIEPWGIDSHTISFETTFAPFIPPLDKAWTVILEKEKPIFEKVAYTGLIGFLMLPAMLYFLFRKRDEDFMHGHVKSFVGAALISWLMAAGIIYHSAFKYIWEAVPLLKQFRGLGRFGISFYYLYMLACSYLLWRTYRKMREKEMAIMGNYLLGAILVVWSFEAWLNIKAVASPVFHENKWLSDKKDDYIPILSAAGHTPADFQAILQLPLLAIGNETFGVARGFWTMREGIHASMETGLPMIDYAMSRTSVSQGMDLIELISSPHREKQRAKLFDSRPILLICEEEFVLPGEKRWIDQAKKLGTYQSITLYTLPSEVFKNITLPVLPDSVNQKSCSGFFTGFDEYPGDTTMTGTGALPVTTAPLSIWKYTDTSSVVRNWEVSFWSHVDNLRGHVPVPRMVETDPAGKVLQNAGLHRESILWSEAYESWIEIAFPLTTQGKDFRYELFIDNTGPVIDNLSIRPLGDTCIMSFPGMVLYNNLPIQMQK